MTSAESSTEMKTKLDDNLAFFYHPSLYSQNTFGPTGKQQFASSFAQAFINVATPTSVACLTPTNQMFQEFAKLIRPYAKKDTACSWIPFQDFGNLQKIGTLFSPTPALAKLAWQRRHLGNRAYSLIGLAHSLSHYLVQDALAELVIGPMEPWDALVCPWQSSKTAILRELAAYGDYLAERFSIPDKIRLGLQLPVIHPFVRVSEQIDKQIGLELRARLQIGSEDIVVMSSGRFSYLTKANPLPMLLALQRTAEGTGRKMHLLLAGWFDSEDSKAQYIEAAEVLAPSLSLHCLDGNKPTERQAAWAAADIYTELNDNTQESFGLSILEAMANSLPVVTSDWAFHKEIIEHDKNGILIPSVGPVPGLTNDLSLLSSLSLIDYQNHIGLASQFVSIDVSECAQAYLTLTEDSNKRETLGRAAKATVEAKFSAPPIIAQYQFLFAELSKLRHESKIEFAPLNGQIAAYPTRLDTAVMFGAFSTDTLKPTSSLTIDGSLNAACRLLTTIEPLAPATLAKPALLPTEELQNLLKMLENKEQITVSDITKQFNSHKGKSLLLSILWMAKMGLIKIR